jgi:hypothetical protein
LAAIAQEDVMPKRVTPARVFALTAWTIKVDEKGRYFVSPTAFFDDKNRWAGPYNSLQYATNAIAGKLKNEFLIREKRLAGVR